MNDQLYCFRILIFLLFTTLLVSCSYENDGIFTQSEQKNILRELESEVIINNHIFSVEIADTVTKKQVGLMNQEHLADNRGMLFVFSHDDIQQFWMKNTIIPLDMISINSTWEIVAIISNVQPCSEDPCPIISVGPAQYVLEVRGNLSQEYGFVVGEKVKLV